MRSILIFLFLIPGIVKSQTLILEDSTGLKKGIYRKFSEFKYNAPSILDNFSIQENDIKVAGHKKDSSIHKMYSLICNTYSNKDTVWGFCDGKNIYLNPQRGLYETHSKGCLYDPELNFGRLEYLGRYCYFTQLVRGEAREDMGAKYQWFGGIIIPHLEKFLLNINNGRIYYIYDTTMKEILSRDESIYSKYKTERYKYDQYFRYLKLYSETHNEEIKK
jgi:hypothetical protein